jgi:hypothetical protein
VPFQIFFETSSTQFLCVAKVFALNFKYLWVEFILSVSFVISRPAAAGEKYAFEEPP